jgi:hypothetical protein
VSAFADLCDLNLLSADFHGNWKRNIAAMLLLQKISNLSPFIHGDTGILHRLIQNGPQNLPSSDDFRQQASYTQDILSEAKIELLVLVCAYSFARNDRERDGCVCSSPGRRAESEGRVFGKAQPKCLCSLRGNASCRGEDWSRMSVWPVGSENAAAELRVQQ